LGTWFDSPFDSGFDRRDSDPGGACGDQLVVFGSPGGLISDDSTVSLARFQRSITCW
jgi:hypothetical protein